MVLVKKTRGENMITVVKSWDAYPYQAESIDFPFRRTEEP
jgi:hypothetical protein